MADQADKLRKLVIDAAPNVRGAGALPPTIVVTGGKGGVGATTVAINLAASLAQHGRRTVLLDAAPNADAAQLVGLDVERGRTLEDVLAGSIDASDALLAGPAGISLLASQWAGAGTPDRTPKSLDRLMDQLQQLYETADALVIDSGSSVTNWTRRLWQEAALVLVVTTPDDVAVMDTYATIKRLIGDDKSTDVRVLVNACRDAATATDVQSRLSASCRRFLGRSIGRAPLVSRHIGELDRLHAPPLAWETLAAPFARNIHQLGRFADDVLSHRKRTRRLEYELSTC